VGVRDRYFNKIWDLKKEWGDLSKRDLILVCENPDFAGYGISIGANAAYLEDPKREQLVKDTFVAENKTPDLSIFCGRVTEERFLKQDLAKVRQFWAAVDRAKGIQGPAAETHEVSLDSAIDNLLGNDDATGPKPASTPAPQGDPDAGEGGVPDQAPKEKVGAGAPSFDDILSGL
jgi:hypothetical protein